MSSSTNGKSRFRSLRKKGCHYMLLIPLLMAFHDTRGQNPSPAITQMVTFDQSNLEISNVTGADDHMYSKVTYQGLQNSISNQGSPSLPVQYVKLIVPKDKNYSKITVDLQGLTSINLPHEVFPVQYPVPTGEQPVSPPFASPNPEIYHTESPYPSVSVKYVSEGYFDGDKHIITLAVYPAVYVPNASRLDFYNTISFTVEENPEAPVTMLSISRNPVAKQDLYNKPLHEMIANPDDIQLFASAATSTANAAEGQATAGKFKYYEYVIITSHALRPDFEELLGWKRRKGLNAGIVEIEDILADPAYSSGDQISGINDDAGKLRQYLLDAYKGGTVYALLGGDTTAIPVRYAAGIANEFNDAWAGNCHIPSDLYYTDFNGNWNVDGDIYFGEDGEDNVDYAPEIFVGRVLARTNMEVRNMVHKIIRYERNPGRGDNKYVSRAFMTQADQMVDGPWSGFPGQAEAVINHLSFYAPGSVNLWNEAPSGNSLNPTFPNATDVVSEIEKNYGLVSLIGHGSPNNIAVATSDYNGCGPLEKQKVTCLDAINGWCAPTQAGNGLDNLDDFDHVSHPYQDYPHLFYTIACETVPINDELQLPGDATMGETYTKYHKAGAAAYMGNTRNGWVGTSYLLFMNFADQVAKGNYHIGVAEGLSKVGFFDTWDNKTHTLIGCPETEMWTAKPDYFGGATVIGGGGTITVNTGGVTGATIGIMSALDNGWSYNQLAPGATSYTFYGVPDQYAVCITKHDYVPFLWNHDVTIQNHDFYGTAYVASPNDITSGENIDKSQPTGPVTVKDGANVYFHADNKGTILLDRGFEVEPNAAFEAK